MNNKDLLNASKLPDVATLTRIIERTHDHLAKGIIRAQDRGHDITVRHVASGETSRQILGWVAEFSAEIVVVAIEWETPHMQTADRMGACVVQVISGGRVDGEGEAWAKQWVISGLIADEQAMTAAAMLAAGIEPQRARDFEL